MSKELQEQIRAVQNKGYAVSFGRVFTSQDEQRSQMEHIPGGNLHSKYPLQQYFCAYNETLHFSHWVVYLLHPQWKGRAPEIIHDKWIAYFGATPEEALEEAEFELGMKVLECLNL